jgi:hypothetical protein
MANSPAGKNTALFQLHPKRSTLGDESFIHLLLGFGGFFW